MTLVVTVNGPETIWLVADRRLTSGRRVVKENARKVMFLHTPDGVAILGYAGLGRTVAGTEPADWMSSVLRGRNLPLEGSLGVLADAMKRELQPHMLKFSQDIVPAHHVLVPAFLDNEVRFYTIDMVYAPDRKSYRFRYTRHMFEKPTFRTPKTPRIRAAGSGAPCLIRNTSWVRPLLRMVNAHARGQVSANTVAACLASLNNEVAQDISPKTVGQRCIVVWRSRKSPTNDGGGGQLFFTGTTPDSSYPFLPTIVNGWDMRAFAEVATPPLVEMVKAMREDRPVPAVDQKEIDAKLSRLPDKPDEKLR